MCTSAALTTQRGHSISRGGRGRARKHVPHEFQRGKRFPRTQRAVDGWLIRYRVRVRFQDGLVLEAVLAHALPRAAKVSLGGLRFLAGEPLDLARADPPGHRAGACDCLRAIRTVLRAAEETKSIDRHGPYLAQLGVDPTDQNKLPGELCIRLLLAYSLDK